MVNDLSLEPQDGDAPPKTGGRPLSTNPRAVQARQQRAKRGSTRRKARPANPLADKAPAGRPSRASKASSDSFHAIRGMLMMCNGAIAFTTPADVLSACSPENGGRPCGECELDQLTHALLNDPWTGGPLTKVKAFAHAPLLMCAVSIAVPRLVRHGLIPASIFGGEPATGPGFVGEPDQPAPVVEPNGAVDAINIDWRGIPTNPAY